MATSVSASRKRASQHLAIGVYIVNRTLHARLWIRILSSRVQLDMSRVSAISSWTREDKIRIHKRACNILCLLSSNSIVVTARGGFNLFEAFYRRGNPALVNFTTSRTDKFLGSNWINLELNHLSGKQRHCSCCSLTFPHHINTRLKSVIVFFLFVVVQYNESAIELAYSYRHDDIVDYLMASSRDKVSTIWVFPIPGQ